MLIASITGVTSATQLRVEKSISKLQFRIRSQRPDIAYTTLKNELLTVKKVSRSTSSEFNIITSTTLDSLAVINSYLEGSFTVNYSYDPVGNIQGFSHVFFNVDLSFLGGLKLDSDSYLSIDITNLGPSMTYDIFGLEYLGQSGLFEEPCRYQLLSVPVGERIKAFNVQNSDLIAVEMQKSLFDAVTSPLQFTDYFGLTPLPNGLDKVQIIYSNGANANLSPFEMALLNLDTNDVTCYITNPPTFPSFYSHLYMIDVEDVATLEIQKDASSSVNVLLIDFPNQ